MKPYKICKKCGADYETEQLFLAKTKFVGIQKFAPYNMLNLELRDCGCGTTLARRMPMGEEGSFAPILVTA